MWQAALARGSRPACASTQVQLTLEALGAQVHVGLLQAVVAQRGAEGAAVCSAAVQLRLREGEVARQVLGAQRLGLPCPLFGALIKLQRHLASPRRLHHWHPHLCGKRWLARPAAKHVGAYPHGRRAARGASQGSRRASFGGSPA